MEEFQETLHTSMKHVGGDGVLGGAVGPWGLQLGFQERSGVSAETHPDPCRVQNLREVPGCWGKPEGAQHVGGALRLTLTHFEGMCLCLVSNG